MYGRPLVGFETCVVVFKGAGIKNLERADVVLWCITTSRGIRATIEELEELKNRSNELLDHELLDHKLLDHESPQLACNTHLHVVLFVEHTKKKWLNDGRDPSTNMMLVLIRILTQLFNWH